MSKKQWLRAETLSRHIGVDREAGMIRGVILAEEGPFKSEGRGEFDSDAISQIVKLGQAKPRGLKVRFTHPDVSNDGLGKYLGRTTNIRKQFVMRETDEGRAREVAVVRGDHTFSDSAHNTPSGDLATYIMDLAEDDPDALGMSLVLKADEEFRTDSKGNLATNADGEALPPLWRPTSLHAVDFVDTGDATNSLLAYDDLPDNVVRQATELLRQQFAGKDRDFVESHLRGYVEKVLSHYWPLDGELGDLRRRLKAKRRQS